MRHFTRRKYWTFLQRGAYVLDAYTMFYFSVRVDDENVKEVLSVDPVRISNYKDENPDDSASCSEIGLSSEEEADSMSEDECVARKYHRGKKAKSAPEPDPVPPVPSVPPQPQTGTEMATVQVPIAMLHQVYSALGQLLQGQQPQLPSMGNIPQPPKRAAQPAPGTGLPFAVPKVSREEKKCQFCQRVFWAPETFRRHLKTHLGTQHNICPNEGCGRKLSSKRSLDLHLTTCGVPKDIFCPKKDCKSRFATKQALQHHLSNHQVLKKSEQKCPGCDKADFTKLKSKKDHWRYCPGNPNRIGPFYCPVPGCHRGEGTDQPFERTRNLNQHLRVAHGHDPKHTKQ